MADVKIKMNDQKDCCQIFKIIKNKVSLESDEKYSIFGIGTQIVIV